MNTASKRIRRLVLLAATGAIGACDPSVTIEDDLYPDTGSRDENADGDVLHTPYATGSRFGVRVEGTESDSCEGLRYESEDATVIEVAPDAEDLCRAVVTAVGPGRARLRVRDADDEEVRAATIEVATATRATLHPRGMFRAGMPEAEDDWQSAKVVVGETASFTVRWFDAEGRELAAHELLVATADDDGLALGPPPGRIGNPDALQVTPGAAGTHTAQVGPADERFASIQIEAVPMQDVAELTLVRSDARGAVDERSMLVAIGRDASGEPVFGLQPTWNVEGAPIRDDGGDILEGDLFLFAPGGSSKQVEADSGSLVATSDVAFHDAAAVESSNGCHATPGLPAPTNAVLLVAAGLLTTTVRRRLRRV